MMPENNTVLVYKGTLDRLALVDQLLFGGGGRPLAESLAMGRSLMLVVFWAQKEPVVLSNHTATHSPADLKTVHVPAKLLRLFCNHFASASATPLSIFSPAMLRQYTDFALGALLNSLRQRLEDAKPLQGLDRICAIAFGIYSLTGGGVPVPHLLEPSAHLMKGQGETFFLEFLEASIDTKSGQAREAGKPSLAINCPPAKTSHQDQAAGGAGFGQQTQAAQTLTSPRPPAMVKNAPTPQAKVTGPVAHPSPPPAPASTTPLAPASAPAPRTATEERTKESGVLTLTEDFILPSSSSNPAALLPPGTAHANSALKAAKQPPKPRLEGTRGAPGALSTSLALTRLSWQVRCPWLHTPIPYSSTPPSPNILPPSMQSSFPTPCSELTAC